MNLFKSLYHILIAILCFFILTGCDYDSGPNDENKILTASITPADNSTEVAIDTEIVILFSYPVNTDGWSVSVDGTQITSGIFSDNNTVLTIQSPDLLERNSLITVILSGFGTKDGTALSEEYTSFQFNTISFLPTAVIEPSNEDENIGPWDDIVITFSEPMDASSSWYVEVNEETYYNSSSGIEWTSNNILTINPETPFLREADIDVSLNDFAAELDAYPLTEGLFVRFTTGSSPVTSINPADGSEEISINQNIVITFNEPVNNDLYWQVTIGTDDYDQSSSSVSWSIDYTILTIDPEPLDRASVIAVACSGFTAALDDAPVPEAAISFNTSTTLPEVTEFSPENGDVDVSTNTNIVITFSEPMNTDNSWSVTIDGDAYSSSSDGISWNTENTELSINPSNSLLRSSEITIELTGFTADLDDTELSGDTLITFTTIDTSTTATISPADSATNISTLTPVTITFNEYMNTDNAWSITIDGTVYTAASTDNISWEDNIVLTVTPSSPFSRNNDIAVSIEGFTSSFDNNPCENVSATFTTIAAPQVTFTPADSTTNVSTLAPVIITFNEAMNTDNSWSVTINGTSYTASSTDFILWEEDTILTITPLSPFSRNSDITVSIEGFTSAFDNNPCENISATFTTIAAPQATITPTEGYSSVSMNFIFKIRFYEEMVADDDWSVLINDVEYNKDTYGYVWQGNQLSIAPSESYSPGAELTVTLSGFNASVDNAPYDEVSSLSYTVSSQPGWNILGERGFGADTLNPDCVDIEDGIIYILHKESSDSYVYLLKQYDSEWTDIGTLTLPTGFFVVNLFAYNSEVYACISDRYDTNRILRYTSSGTWETFGSDLIISNMDYPGGNNFFFLDKTTGDFYLIASEDLGYNTLYVIKIYQLIAGSWGLRCEKSIATYASHQRLSGKSINGVPYFMYMVYPSNRRTFYTRLSREDVTVSTNVASEVTTDFASFDLYFDGTDIIPYTAVSTIIVSNGSYPEGHTYVCYYNGSSWQTILNETIYAPKHDMQIQVTNDRTPYIAYMQHSYYPDASAQNIYVKRYTGTGWQSLGTVQKTLLPYGSFGYFKPKLLTDNNTPYIFFRDNYYGNGITFLKYE